MKKNIIIPHVNSFVCILYADRCNFSSIMLLLWICSTICLNLCLGLGETCEKIENDDDILSCDLNDDIDLLNNTNTIQDGDEQKTKSPADLSADEETTSRDIANIDDSGSKQAFDNNDPGYKTPLVHKYKRNSSAHSESATPCLFSPDLLSQETQGILGFQYFKIKHLYYVNVVMFTVIFMAIIATQISLWFSHSWYILIKIKLWSIEPHPPGLK